ncbi:hypothetical protein ACK8GE_06950 [Micromonosporaceae bacterium DT194]|uniref:hypothetical protein n=1 Tax=Melissospora conviva TaxID=3388432 RepID=UPI003C179807
MINDAIDRPNPDGGGEVLRRLAQVEHRRSRGGTWLPAEQVTAIAADADEQLALVHAELARARREQQSQHAQIEMMRHGTLPSHATTSEPDSTVVELTMQAQLQANQTISEASAEGTEIITDARRQAKAIITAAHRQAAAAANAAGLDGGGGVENLLRRIEHLEASERQLREALAAAQEQARRCQAHLIAYADQLQAFAAQIDTSTKE